MQTNNLPPFYVGQKVVCVDNKNRMETIISLSTLLTTGKQYTVEGIRLGCCKWEVNVGVAPVAQYYRCYICKSRNPTKNESWFCADRFVPIYKLRKSSRRRK